jgi:hypothetical protein
VAGNSYQTGERLDLFLDRANELLAEPAVTEGCFSIQLSFTFSQTDGLSTMSREPTEPLLKSFLVTFRHFVSNKEPVFVNSVANTLWQELRSDKLRGELEASRKTWLAQCRGGPLRVVIDQDHLSPADAVDLWINGRYFHNDKRKAERLNQLDPLGTLLARHVFLNHIISATNYVVFLGQLIVVGRREGLLD